MCGFAGFINPLSEAQGEYILKRMLDPIKHRGPDSTGYALYGDITVSGNAVWTIGGSGTLNII